MKLGVSVSEPKLIPLRPSASSDLAGSTLAVPRPLVLVRLEDADGLVGHGEAAPLPAYDGVSIGAVLAALERYSSVLERDSLVPERDSLVPERASRVEPSVPDSARRPELTHARLLNACAALEPLPQALAAVDLALWDLAGQRAGQPVWQLLGGRDPGPILVNATIGSVAPREAAAEALAALEAGFTAVKVKVGTPDDRQRLKAVRDAVGPDMLLRLDANGAWTQLEAPERIRALSRFEIEIFEEPVHGASAVQAVARQVPQASLALDESADRALVARAGDASGSDEPRVCDALCLKIAASGGITGLLRDARAASAIGYGVYISSTLDGPLGIAAALHVASALRPDRHCGLATLDRFDREPPLRAVDGMMALPAGPGLGDGLLAWYDP